jgi:hypothetical protein
MFIFSTKQWCKINYTNKLDEFPTQVSNGVSEEGMDKMNFFGCY